MSLISANLLPKCPITQDDIKAAEHTFGPDIHRIKIKTVLCPPHKVKTYLEPTPNTIHKQYKNVMMCTDIMFINSITFCLSLATFALEP